MQARSKEHLRSDATLGEVAAECRALDAELGSTEPRTRTQRLELVRRARSLLQAITRQLEPPQRPTAAYDEDYGEDAGLAGEAMATYRREAMELRWLIIRRAAETVFGGAVTKSLIEVRHPRPSAGDFIRVRRLRGSASAGAGVSTLALLAHS